MNLINRLFKKNHRCNFTKPIASKYLTFSSRNIIYECRCGKRKMMRVWRRFDDPFPIDTNILISNQEMERILNNTFPVS